MELEAIRRHWDEWAAAYGTGLRATTKTPTVKRIELAALERVIAPLVAAGATRILEIGCGNGQNALHLARALPQARITGIDYVPAMVEAAEALRAEAGLGTDRLAFAQGDVLQLDLPVEGFDVVFTDRCLINLNTTALQIAAFGSIAALLPSGGHLVMIENETQAHARQNDLRELAGLPRRAPATFNHFFDRPAVLAGLAAAGFTLLAEEDIVSLHDLLLYVLVPMINGGTVDYGHPLVDAAAQLQIAAGAAGLDGAAGLAGFGGFGQNRLYVCRKDAA